MVLAIIGVLMVYSSSMIWAGYKMGNDKYFLIRQLIFFLIGLTIFFIVIKIDSNIYQKYRNIIMIISLLLLIIVLIPGIGIVRGGARSWIGFGDISIQPSEFAKLTLIIFTANYLEKNKEEISNLKTLMPILFIVLLVFLLIMLEPDFGTGFILTLTILSMILISGIKKRYMIFAILIGLLGFVSLILSAPYRLERIFAYLDPYEDPLGSGFQIIQSLYAISPNGFFGRGLFKSFQKYYFLPEPQTDFIFAIIVEELGFIGGVFIIVLFILLFYYGILIAIKAKTLFQTYLACGIILSIFIQFFINIGVVIGLLPVTGVTLPFLSYGGSSLIMNFIMMGILVNISKNDSYL
jgi:cell division protein FtsW